MMTFYQAMRQCYRKKSFPTSKAAHKRRHQIIKQGGQVLYSYGCTQCGNYHLTKNPEAQGQIL